MSNKISFDAASEHLRLALPLMSRQRVPVVPLNYAVWYEYVAGTSAALKDTVDRMLAAGDPVDEDITEQLYRQYIDPSDHARSEATQQSMQKLLEALAETIDSAGSEVSRYEQSLRDCASQLSDDIRAEELRGLVADLITSTRQMNDGNAALQRHLEESQRETEALRHELEKVRVESKQDPLTGLSNRKGFEERVELLGAEEEYAGRPHSLLMADIDKFKSINDTYGHLFGDKIIKVVAKAFSNLTKGKDFAARFGGEEFIILLPDTPLEGARAVAENIRSSIERGRVYNPKTGDEIRRVTISIGVAEMAAGETIERAIARADEALYRAKANGRNRVELSAPARAVIAATG